MTGVFGFTQRAISCVAMFLLAAGTMCAQDALPIPRVANPAVDPVVQRNIEDWAIQQRGLPDDWTHHYLVFSNPGTEQQAIENGKYEQWLSVVNDPRFTLQQIKRRAGVEPAEGADVDPASPPDAMVVEAGAPDEELGTLSPNPPRKMTRHPVKKDWNVAIGGVAASGIGTVATNNASGTSTVTVDGQVFTASAPSTAAGTSGVFLGAPAAGQGVTITNGTNTFTLTTNATASSVVGTVSGAPTSTTAPTITFTNSANSLSSNTLTLTPFPTGATATGTVAGTGPTSGQTITIKNSTTNNTLTLTATTGTQGTGTVTTKNNNGAANGDIVTIGAITYMFEETTTAYSGEEFSGSQYYCQNTTTPCVWWGTTKENTAQAFAAAITNNPSLCPTAAEGLYGNWQYTCYSYVTAPNPSVTAALGTQLVTVTNITGNSIPFNYSSVQTAWTLTPDTGSIAGYTAGTNGCTSATTGTFVLSTTPALAATNLANAINACNSTYSTVGVTAYATGAIVTIASTTLGSAASTLTLGGTANNGTTFTWSPVTTGGSPVNGCSSATTGTFASSSSTATVASNIAAAINACNSSYSAIGVIASYTSGSTFTATSVAAGPYLAVSASNNTGLFTWGSVTGGSAGSNACSSSTSGTFETSNSTVTLATNMAAAINLCTTNGYTAVDVTATSTDAVVILAARDAGSSGNSILGTTMPNFNWSATSMTGGSDGTTSGTTFAYWSGAAVASTAQVAANIAAAINENTTLEEVATGVSATPNGNTVIVTANTAGTGGNSYGTTVANFSGFTWGAAKLSGGAAGAVVQPNLYPAKYAVSFSTASCSDFVVYPTGTAGATGAASIVAFFNLYAGGCSGTVPSVYWGYDTGGMVTTSPVLSLDGTQLAFVQVSGTTASLVLLKWSANSGTATLPVTPAAATAATYRSCTAPCMVTLAFSGSHNDTFSSPFYFYNGDTLFVGDDSGNLHQFTGVFGGTPAEAGAPWPVNLSATSKLSSPVFDPATGYVIVGDFGGILHSVTATSGTIHGTTASIGDVIADAPLLDGSAGFFYAFVTTGLGSYNPYNAVYNLSNSFTTAAGAGVETVGTGGTGYYLYAGTFDNVYYSSDNATGNLYVVGNTGLTTGANLYRIPVANSVMGTPVAAASGLTFAGGAQPWPSPAEEFCNNGASACVSNGTQTTSGTDYVFLSVYRGTPSGCTNTAGNGCVLSYNVSNPSAVTLSGSGLNVTAPAGNGCWPTGGFVVDNSSTFAGASQIYFIGLGTNAAGGSTGETSTNCAASVASTIGATQASQSNP